MKFFLETERPRLDFEIDHGSKVVLIGSCFSDELQSYFENAGFHVLSNPFGTLFHPIAIADEIEKAISSDQEVDVFKRDDEYLAWSASGSIVESSEDLLIKRVVKQRKQLRSFLEDDAILIITLGTAWGYRHKSLDKIVGNCLKADQNIFNKELTELDELKDLYTHLIEDLRKFNPSLKVIFTVSPVRHKKDGLVGNNRSKARLIELVHFLQGDSVNYFPSYEIVLDELRDYRFFTDDLVHPNNTAVTIVWERLSELLFNSSCKELIQRVERVNRMLDHKPINETSGAHVKLLAEVQERMEEVSKSDSRIFWKKIEAVKPLFFISSVVI